MNNKEFTTIIVAGITAVIVVSILAQLDSQAVLLLFLIIYLIGAIIMGLWSHLDPLTRMFSPSGELFACVICGIFWPFVLLFKATEKYRK